MTDVYTGHSQFVLLVDNRRRWFDAKAVFIITVISLPIIIFCGIYTIVLKNNAGVLYPKSSWEASGLGLRTALIYSTYPKRAKFQEITNLGPPEVLDKFNLVCYYNFPDDSNSLMPENIDPFLCTHINVAFASVYNNTISLSAGQLDSLKSVIKLKSINKDLKVLISVGGADNDGGYSEMVLNHANRKAFIRSVLDLVKKFHVDGVDLDWEFPNKIPGGDKYQRMHFTQLLEEFRASINRQVRHKYLLTVAVAAPEFLVDQSYDVSYMNQFVDFVNLMSYDYHFYTRLTPFTGFNSPLFKSSKDDGYLATLNINYSTSYWVARGMERGKIMVGLPTFGHSYRLTNTHNTGLYAPAKGFGKLGSNGFADYPQICRFLALNEIEPVFDAQARSLYAYKGSEWVSFENEHSLTLKTEFIRDHNFGGAMVYSLNSDDHLGICRLSSEFDMQGFPLVKRIREVLDRNYSIF